MSTNGTVYWDSHTHVYVDANDDPLDRRVYIDITGSGEIGPDVGISFPVHVWLAMMLGSEKACLGSLLVCGNTERGEDKKTPRRYSDAPTVKVDNV